MIFTNEETYNKIIFIQKILFSMARSAVLLLGVPRLPLIMRLPVLLLVLLSP